MTISSREISHDHSACAASARLHNDAAESIETLAGQIQKLPPRLRWFHIDEEVIRAAALGMPPFRGKRTAIADQLLAFFGRVGLCRQVAASFNFILLSILYIAQFFVRKSDLTGKNLFVGIGALREPDLLKMFGASSDATVVCLSTFDLSTFYLHKIRFARLYREWKEVWKELWAFFDRGGGANLIKRSYCLTYVMLRGHRYIYFRAWFDSYLETAGRTARIGFTVANEAAFAAIAVGAHALHLQHGFQARSLVYPDFSEAYCSNRFDACHVVRRVPNIRASVAAPGFKPIETRPAVAIAGGYLKSDPFHLCQSFIEWANRAGAPIFVRVHPKDQSGYWDSWRGVDGIHIVDAASTFDEFLETFRPCILATWYSTCILDALAKGVVPVAFIPEDHLAAVNTVFPVRELTLKWPEQNVRVDELSRNSQAARAFARENYHAAIG